MQIDDRLVKQNREQMRKKRQMPEEEETLTYAQRQRQLPLNKNKGAFPEETFGGINTMQSVFDRTAVFHTGEG
ncbi:MAG: hypothetical protein K6E50_11910 [Lachnospiraceae bacterium]|nr:hypothetical protein [Lachnospiraceae bacterium]